MKSFIVAALLVASVASMDMDLLKFNKEKSLYKFDRPVYNELLLKQKLGYPVEKSMIYGDSVEVPTYFQKDEILNKNVVLGLEEIIMTPLFREYMTLPLFRQYWSYPMFQRFVASIYFQRFWEIPAFQQYFLNPVLFYKYVYPLVTVFKYDTNTMTSTYGDLFKGDFLGNKNVLPFVYGQRDLVNTNKFFYPTIYNNQDFQLQDQVYYKNLLEKMYNHLYTINKPVNKFVEDKFPVETIFGEKLIKPVDTIYGDELIKKIYGDKLIKNIYGDKLNKNFETIYGDKLIKNIYGDKLIKDLDTIYGDKLIKNIYGDKFNKNFETIYGDKLNKNFETIYGDKLIKDLDTIYGDKLIKNIYGDKLIKNFNLDTIYGDKLDTIYGDKLVKDVLLKKMLLKKMMPELINEETYKTILPEEEKFNTMLPTMYKFNPLVARMLYGKRFPMINNFETEKMMLNKKDLIDQEMFPMYLQKERLFNDKLQFNKMFDNEIEIPKMMDVNKFERVPLTQGKPIMGVQTFDKLEKFVPEIKV